jgi:hypothetical protein
VCVCVCVCVCVWVCVCVCVCVCVYQFGVLVDGASLCCLKANVIFGNQFEALHVEHVSQPTVQG